MLHHQIILNLQMMLYLQIMFHLQTILNSDNVLPSGNIKPADNVLLSDNVQHSANVKSSDNALPSDTVRPSDNVLPSDNVPPSDYIKPSDNVLLSYYFKPSAHVHVATSDSVTPSIPFQSNLFVLTHILSPFPLQILPSTFRHISGVDLTHHHHLHYSVAEWIASVLPLLQLLVHSFHLKYILLFCRRDMSHSCPFSPVIKAIQEALPLWYLSTNEFLAHKFGASIRGCQYF